MTEKKIINDEKLESVSGGGSGYSENGFIFSNYDTIETSRYYTFSNKFNKKDKVFYVTGVSGNSVTGSIEYIYIDGKNWYTEHFYNTTEEINEFKKYHPYIVNIRP